MCKLNPANVEYDFLSKDENNRWLIMCREWHSEQGMFFIKVEIASCLDNHMNKFNVSPLPSYIFYANRLEGNV